MVYGSEIDPAMDRPTTSRTNSGQGLSAGGVLLSAGNWWAGDLTSVTCNAVSEAG
ncbi:hypothetical protein ACWCQW_33810 [Streptomyces mirabilis]